MSELTGTDLGSPALPAHGGRREEAARQYGIPKQELLDFSSSINLLGPPQGVAGAVKVAATEIAYYPEEGAAAVKAVMADYLGVLPAQIVPGNGSIELIYWLAAALKPRRPLVVEPTFSEYRRACLGAGAACDSFRLREDEGFAFEAGLLDPRGHDLVFLCNPNNPTGYLTPVDELARLWRRCRAAGAGLVVDEAFVDFAGEEASLLETGVSEGLYILRSFTKSHALAGLRLGCLVADSGYAENLGSMLPPWNINVFAQAAGQAALSDWEYIARARRETRAARRMLFDQLADLPGLFPLPSEANFLLCRLEGIGSGELADRLARVGILVRDCRSFEGMGDRFIRVAVRSRRENYHLVAALGKALA